MEDLLTRVGVAQPRTAAERIMQTTAAGASGGAGGVAVGKAVEAAAAGPVAREVGRLMATTPVLQTISGGTAAASGGVAKEAGAGTAGQIAATVGGAFVPSIPAAARAVTQQVAKQIAPAGAGIRERVEPTTIQQLRAGKEVPAEPTITESLQSIKATVGEKISPQDQQNIRKQIEQNPDSTEMVNFRLSGTQAVPDNQAMDAIMFLMEGAKNYVEMIGMEGDRFKKQLIKAMYDDTQNYFTHHITTEQRRNFRFNLYFWQNNPARRRFLPEDDDETS
jgi:hypothetical protein